MKCHLLLFFTTTMNHFSIKLWPATKSEFYMTTGNNQLSGWTKEKLQSTSQSQTCTMVTVCWSVSALIHYSFLNPSEITTSEKYAQQVNEMKWNEMKLLSSARLFAIPRTIACQAPLSMGFSRQEYWSGLLFPSPEDLRNPGIEPGSSALQADSLLSEPLEKPQQINGMHQKLQCLPVLVNRRGPVLLQDNDRVHHTHTIFQKLNELVSVLPHL